MIMTDILKNWNFKLTAPDGQSQIVGFREFDSALASIVARLGPDASIRVEAIESQEEARRQRAA